MTGFAAPPDVLGLVNDISQAHGLGFVGQRHVLSAVMGWRGGNRDVDLYRLGALMAQAPRGMEAPAKWLWGFLLPQGADGWRVRDRALLDIILTIAMEMQDGAYDGMACFLDEITAARLLPTNDGVARALVSAFARVVHAFRRKVLPEARLHNTFVAVRGVFGDRVLVDGDTLTLWEQAGTRTLLTRYDSALHAAIDYVEAQVLAASWAHPVAPDALADIEVSADAVTGSAPDRADTQGALIEALDAIGAFPVKLLKRSEITALMQLAAHGRWAGHWPRSVLGAQALARSQGRIIQDLRKPSGRPLSAFLPTADQDSFTGVISELAQLLDNLVDAVFLVTTLLPKDDMFQNALARSKTDPKRDKRIVALKRRKSYCEALEAFSVENMAAQARAILGPLGLVHDHVTFVMQRWCKLDEQSLRIWEEGDKPRHRSKLISLYSADFPSSDSEILNG